MERIEVKNRNSFLRLFSDIAFWAVFFLFLWLIVDMKLIYFNDASILNFPEFFLTIDFFKEFLYPGGLIEYANAFVSQLFYYSICGALVVTAVCAAVAFFADVVFKKTNIKKLRFARFIPALALAFLYTCYSHYLVSMLVLLTVLIAFTIYLYAVKKSPAADWLIFIVLSAIVYAAAGSGLLVFALLCFLYELFYRQKYKLLAVYVAVSALLPYVMFTFVYSNVTIVDAYTNLMPFSWKIVQAELRDGLLIVLYVVYFAIPFVLLLAGLVKLLTPRPQYVPNKKKKNQQPGPLKWHERHPALSQAIGSCILLLISAAVVLPFHEKNIKIILLTSYYSRHEMWSEVLETASKYKRSNYFINNVVNRALYHSGRLGYDLFEYIQHPDSFLLNSEQYKEVYYRKVDVFFDLGLMNTAEHYLAVDIDMVGERPFMLKSMALINIIKGNIPAARAYLNALSNTVFYSDWAKEYLDKLDADPTFADDSFIQQKKSALLRKTYLGILKDPQVFVYLLDADPKNKMAYEYLMAWSLVAKDFDSFVGFLPKMSNFDYETIPPLWQQAILASKAVGRKINPKDYQISQRTMQIFNDFDVVMKRNFGNKQSAYPELFKKYKSTYFFYLTYVQ